MDVYHRSAARNYSRTGGIFQNGVRRHLGFLKFRKSQEGQYASPCQIFIRGDRSNRCRDVFTSPKLGSRPKRGELGWRSRCRLRRGLSTANGWLTEQDEQTSDQVHFWCRKLCCKVTKCDVHILWLTVSLGTFWTLSYAYCGYRFYLGFTKDSQNAFNVALSCRSMTIPFSASASRLSYLRNGWG